MKELDITQAKARKLAKQICEDFEIPPCYIYFVDLYSLDLDTLGLYVEKNFDINLGAYMLIEQRWSRRLVLVLHEMCHHFQRTLYNSEGKHGKSFTLAKGRMTTWAKKNISDNFDWFHLIKFHTDGRMTRRLK